MRHCWIQEWTVLRQHSSARIRRRRERERRRAQLERDANCQTKLVCARPRIRLDTRVILAVSLSSGRGRS
jgi:hypothetical protein